jgi:hypothetical protein
MLLPKSDVAAGVIEMAFQNQAAYERTPEGKVWLAYLKNVQSTDLRASPEGKRPVPNTTIVSKVLEKMRTDVKAMKEEFAQLPKLRNFNETQAQLLAHVEGGLARASQGATIPRATLVELANLFSVAATQQIYLRETRVQNYTDFGSFDDIVRRAKIDEAYLDAHYGITALPLPSVEHLGFRRFLELEPTGIIPLGVTSKYESVDGGLLEPERFYTHDWDHQRFRMDNMNRPFLGAVSGRPLFDYALHVAGERALKFLDKLITQIDGLPTRREQVIVEGLIFQIMHEENTASGIIGFHRGHIRTRAKALLRSRRRGSRMSTRDYDYVLKRFQDDDDFGQAFKNKPTDAELVQLLKWLASLP